MSEKAYEPAVGDTVIMAQDFNATCGVVESLGSDGLAVLHSAHDMFGSKGRVRAPIWSLKKFAGPARRLTVQEALM